MLMFPSVPSNPAMFVGSVMVYSIVPKGFLLLTNSILHEEAVGMWFDKAFSSLRNLEEEKASVTIARLTRFGTGNARRDQINDLQNCGILPLFISNKISTTLAMIPRIDLLDCLWGCCLKETRE